MALDVSLGDDPHADLVAQLQERGIVGVVRGPDGIEPELPHLDDVRAHRRDRNHPPGPFVEVVAIDASDEDRPPVQEQTEPVHLDAAEADADGGLFHQVAGR